MILWHHNVSSDEHILIQSIFIVDICFCFDITNNNVFAEMKDIPVMNVWWRRKNKFTAGKIWSGEICELATKAWLKYYMKSSFPEE